MILIFFQDKMSCSAQHRILCRQLLRYKRQALFYLSPARYFARTRLILPVGFRSSLKDAS